MFVNAKLMCTLAIILDINHHLWRHHFIYWHSPKFVVVRHKPILIIYSNKAISLASFDCCLPICNLNYWILHIHYLLLLNIYMPVMIGKLLYHSWYYTVMYYCMHWHTSDTICCESSASYILWRSHKITTWCTSHEACGGIYILKY